MHSIFYPFPLHFFPLHFALLALVHFKNSEFETRFKLSRILLHCRIAVSLLSYEIMATSELTLGPDSAPKRKRDVDAQDLIVISQSSPKRNRKDVDADDSSDDIDDVELIIDESPKLDQQYFDNMKEFVRLTLDGSNHKEYPELSIRQYERDTFGSICEHRLRQYKFFVSEYPRRLCCYLLNRLHKRFVEDYFDGYTTEQLQNLVLGTWNYAGPCHFPKALKRSKLTLMHLRIVAIFIRIFSSKDMKCIDSDGIDIIFKALRRIEDDFADSSKDNTPKCAPTQFSKKMF